MPHFPDPSASSQTLSDTVYSRLLEDARGAAKAIVPLQVGDTWMLPHESARSEAQRCEEIAGLHNYAPVQGVAALREAVLEKLAAQLGEAIDPANLQIMSGATVGLSVICQALLDPLDEVLLPAPYWPLIRGIIRARGAVPVEIPFWDRLCDPVFDRENAGSTAALEATELLLKSLRERVNERSVAIYLNSPNNPTGKILPEALAEGIAALAAEKGLWLLCDEAYEDLIFQERPARPLWTRSDFRERAVVCHTFSKSYGLAGARVGYTHGPHEIMKAIRGVQTFVNYGAPTPMQFAAARALQEAKGWCAQARESYREAALMASQALSLPMPEAGTFLFFDVSSFFLPGEELLDFLRRIFKETGVLLTPGPACGASYSTHLRMCYSAVPPEQLKQALDALAPFFSPID